MKWKVLRKVALELMANWTPLSYFEIAAADSHPKLLRRRPSWTETTAQLFQAAQKLGSQEGKRERESEQ